MQFFIDKELDFVCHAKKIALFGETVTHSFCLTAKQHKVKLFVPDVSGITS